MTTNTHCAYACNITNMNHGSSETSKCQCIKYSEFQMQNATPLTGCKSIHSIILPCDDKIWDVMNKNR